VSSVDAGEAGGQLYPDREGQGGYTPLQKTPGIKYNETQACRSRQFLVFGSGSDYKKPGAGGD